MDYNRSSQARLWMFDEISLASCKQRAVLGEENNGYSSIPVLTKKSTDGIRKFASGFHHRLLTFPGISNASSTSIFSTNDQNLLVQFHAHQIQTMVGPSAIFNALRTSETVLSTAITFFRRFYLSNSMLETNPRTIAAACAFLAAKVEEERVDIELLSHATTVFQSRIHQSHLCYKELRAVTVAEIEEAERHLMYGLDYVFLCYHTSSALQNLLPDLFASQTKADHVVESQVLESRHSLIGLALDVSRRALIFTDAPFLFTPCHTAFAIASMVLGCITNDGKMGKDMQSFIEAAFPRKNTEELVSFTRRVHNVVQFLEACPLMDLQSTNGRAKDIVATRAMELQSALENVESLRKIREPTDLPPKRTFCEADFSPFPNRARKFAKVTPMAKRGSRCDSNERTKHTHMNQTHIIRR